jgi:hypothetical protein
MAELYWGCYDGVRGIVSAERYKQRAGERRCSERRGANLIVLAMKTWVDILFRRASIALLYEVDIDCVQYTGEDHFVIDTKDGRIYI